MTENVTYIIDKGKVSRADGVPVTTEEADTVLRANGIVVPATTKGLHKAAMAGGND